MCLLCAQFKEELMAAMGLNTEEQGSAMAFFRRGYRVCRRCYECCASGPLHS